MTLLSYPKISDYGQVAPPSALESAGLSAMRPITESALFINQASHWALGTPLDKTLKDSLDLIDYKLSNPEIGTAQNITNAAASIAGSVLDPVSLFFAGIGGKVLGTVAKTSLDLLPDAIGGLSEGAISKEFIQSAIDAEVPAFRNNKWASVLPKSYGDAIERVAETSGAFAGFDVPSAFNENYRADTNQLDYGGMVKSVALNGGIGIAFPPVMWALGLITGKLDRVTQEVVSAAAEAGKTVTVINEAMPTRLQIADKALQDGKITPEEHEFYTRFHVEPTDTAGHLQRALRVLGDNEHPVNALTNNVEIPFLTADEMKQLQVFAADQLSSSVPENMKDALTTVVSHNMVDRLVSMLRENPSMMDALSGHLDSIAERLENKLGSLERADEYVEKNMRRAEERLQPIEQKKLMRMLEKGELTHKELPFVVPKNVKGIRTRLGNIKKLKIDEKNAEKEFKRTGKMKFKKKLNYVRGKIKDAEADLKAYQEKNPVLPQAKELDAIQNHLLSEKGLPEGYQSKPEYLRLLDLAHFSSRARRLVERVRLRAAYEQQEAIHDVMRGIAQIAESGVKEIANPRVVTDYIKERIETNLNIPEQYREMDEKVSNIEAEANEPLASKQESIDAQIQSINENPDVSSGVKKEFNTLQERLKQFEGAESARAEMVNCIMGAANVSI